MVLTFAIVLLIAFATVRCQIDLGSFSLGQNRRGDLEVAFNQAANILGFGGDRGIDLTIGEGRFGTKARQGALIGGERIGIDSGIGVNEAEGLNLGSLLNFGNNQVPSNNPGGQFVSFLERIGKFFATLGKQADSPAPTLSSANTLTETKSIAKSNGIAAFKPGTVGETMRSVQTDDTDYDDYYHDAAVEDGAVQKQVNGSDVFPQKDITALNRTLEVISV